MAAARRHSGWWPDAPAEEVCPAIGYFHDHSLVLRYADRPAVALTTTCETGGMTSGTRTRIDNAKPRVVDEFLRRFEQQ